MPQYLDDLSPNNRDGTYTPPRVSLTKTGLVFTDGNSALALPTFTIPPAITVEMWLISNRQSRPSKLLDGPLFLHLTDASTWQFGFGPSLYQGYGRTPSAEPIYVTLSHTFGQGQDTTITVNGERIIGGWRSNAYAVSFNDSTDIATISAIDLPSFSRVSFASSGTLPSPLVRETNYWTIRQSSTTSRLAATRADAVAGSFISLTSAGTGAHVAYVYDGQQMPPFSGFLTVALGKSDVMQQLRISSEAKSLETVRDYFKGISG